jgi:hypothetical protein
MSTSLTTPLSPVAETAAAARRWPTWLREPLLHFVVLGAALFAVDHALIVRADDPRAIIIGPEVDKEARDLFKSQRGQDPTPQQLAALRQVWLDNEVLYREGMALKVDQGDTAIRERVIFKAISIVETNLKAPPLNEDTLRGWFEAHRDKYDEPPRYDFQEAVLSGEGSEAAVRAFVANLNGSTPGEAKAGLRVFKGRPRGNLDLSYGPEFAKALETIPPGEWRALKTREGWRAMRLDGISSGTRADFDALRASIRQDWTDAVMAEQRTAAVRALAKKYKILYEGGQQP